MKMKDSELFKRSFRPDKRKGLVLVWEVILILVLVLGFSVWVVAMNSLTPLIEAALPPTSTMTTTFEQTIAMSQSLPVMVELRNKTIFYTVLMALYFLAAVTLFKGLSYLALRRKCVKKVGAVFFARFLGLEILWWALMFVLLLAVQLLLYRGVGSKIAYSSSSRALLLVISVLVVQLVIYFTSTLFIVFTKTERVFLSIKQWFRLNIIGFSRFIIPILLVFLVFVFLNILILVFRLLPSQVSMFLSTVLFVLYVVWTKIYYSDILDSVERSGKHDVGRHKIKDKGKLKGKGKGKSKIEFKGRKSHKKKNVSAKKGSKKKHSTKAHNVKHDSSKQTKKS